MKLEYLDLGGGQQVAIHVASRGGNLLVECREPGPLLARIAADRMPPRLSPDSVLRGVVSRDRESVFQLFDALGGASDEIRVRPEQVCSLLGTLW